MASNQALVDVLGCRNDPRPLQLLGEAGYLWSYLGRWQEAQEVFQALTVLVPQDPAGHLGLAEIALMRNQYPQAQKHAEQAVKAAVGRTDANMVDRATAARAHVVAAKAWMHQKKVDRARQAFEKAVEVDPDGPSGRHAADMLESGKLMGLLA